MSINHTMQNPFVQMRSADVTVADASFDGSNSGYRYTDITKRNVFEFDPAANGVEVIFAAEADDGDTFGCEIWNVSTNGLATKVADITGAAGTAYADFTNRDSTARLFIGSITISEEFHLKDVTVADTGNNRIARLGWDILGAKFGYISFHSIAGVGQCDRIMPWIRFF